MQPPPPRNPIPEIFFLAMPMLEGDLRCIIIEVQEDKIIEQSFLAVRYALVKEMTRMFTFHCRALHFKNQSIRGDTGEGPVNCSFHKSLSNGHSQLTSFGTGMYMYMHLISPSRCYSPDDLLCSFHSWRADYFLFKLPQKSSKL